MIEFINNIRTYLLWILLCNICKNDKIIIIIYLKCQRY